MCTITEKLQVQVFESDIDSVPVVQIDTEAPGPIRVALNDGTIWDGDPEQDVPELLDGFAISFDWGAATCMACVRCEEQLVVTSNEVRLREFVALAKSHICRKGGVQ